MQANSFVELKSPNCLAFHYLSPGGNNAFGAQAIVAVLRRADPIDNVRDLDLAIEHALTHKRHFRIKMMTTVASLIMTSIFDVRFSSSLSQRVISAELVRAYVIGLADGWAGPTEVGTDTPQLVGQEFDGFVPILQVCAVLLVYAQFVANCHFSFLAKKEVSFGVHTTTISMETLVYVC